MNWEVDSLPEVKRDNQKLDRSQQIIVSKAMKQVQENPLSQDEGGFGKPPGHKSGRNLTGLLKAKLKKKEIHIVYKIMCTDTRMLIVVIGVQEDEEVHDLAKHRVMKHNL